MSTFALKQVQAPFVTEFMAFTL